MSLPTCDGPNCTNSTLDFLCPECSDNAELGFCNQECLYKHRLAVHDGFNLALFTQFVPRATSLAAKIAIVAVEAMYPYRIEHFVEKNGALQVRRSLLSEPDPGDLFPGHIPDKHKLAVLMFQNCVLSTQVLTDVVPFLLHGLDFSICELRISRPKQGFPMKVLQRYEKKSSGDKQDRWGEINHNTRHRVICIAPDNLADEDIPHHPKSVIFDPSFSQYGIATHTASTANYFFSYTKFGSYMRVLDAGDALKILDDDWQDDGMTVDVRVFAGATVLSKLQIENILYRAVGGEEGICKLWTLDEEEYAGVEDNILSLMAAGLDEVRRQVDAVRLLDGSMQIPALQRLVRIASQG
ncbi:hypothetical protein BDV96DRAFT_648155 [Lophiotrema nucula]|uniref:Uncharacterized protein n=1 Tax=Lophiotrema nucula TaxID=690887 RepID=A0A6A5Z173_9PLEO|nr:hypothetical protein BDV96DRAFT_648155 [Lophiotrema nucula]